MRETISLPSKSFHRLKKPSSSSSIVSGLLRQFDCVLFQWHLLRSTRRKPGATKLNCKKRFRSVSKFLKKHSRKKLRTIDSMERRKVSPHQACVFVRVVAFLTQQKKIFASFCSETAVDRHGRWRPGKYSRGRRKGQRSSWWVSEVRWRSNKTRFVCIVVADPVSSHSQISFEHQKLRRFLFCITTGSWS